MNRVTGAEPNRPEISGWRRSAAPTAWMMLNTPRWVAAYLYTEWRHIFTLSGGIDCIQQLNARARYIPTQSRRGIRERAIHSKPTVLNRSTRLNDNPSRGHFPVLREVPTRLADWHRKVATELLAWLLPSRSGYRSVGKCLRMRSPHWDVKPAIGQVKRRLFESCRRNYQ